MWSAIETLPRGRVGKPEVSAQVNNLRCFAQSPYQGGRLPVRQREEHQLAILKGFRFRRLHREFAQGLKVGVDVAQLLPNLRVASNRSDIELWVVGQEPQELTSGISRCTCHTYRNASHAPTIRICA